MTGSEIREKLIKRLFLGWLTLSLVLGGIVYVVEIEEVDDLVKRLASDESRLILKETRDFINSREEGHPEILLEKIKEFVEKGHFVIIELYNADKKLAVEVVTPEKEEVEVVLNLSDHSDYLADKVDYRKFYISDRIYIQVFSPLYARGVGIVGFFEGVYEVSDETMAAINKRTALSLAIVVLVILVTTVLLYPIILSLNKELIKYSLDLSQANIGMLKVLGGAISKRDSDTHVHNYRVTLLAIRLGEIVGLQERQLRGLVKGAFLHDVGKIGISDSILLKKGGHTEEEREIMKNHVRHGVDIIKNYSWLNDAVEIVQFHHERFNGEGYLASLKGENIPLNARIFTIVDVFDALTSVRPYKEALSFEQSMAVLEEGSGTFFDPQLLESFQKVARKLYDETSGVEERVLEERLNESLKKYFR